MGGAAAAVLAVAASAACSASAASSAGAASAANPARPSASCTQPVQDSPGKIAALADIAEQNAESFDAVWVIIRDTHWDPTLGGLDWNAVRVELRPVAARAASAAELRGVMTQMIERLGQSHFAVMPGEMLLESEDEEEKPVAEDAPAESNAPAAHGSPAREPKPEHKPKHKPQRRSARGGDTGAALMPLPSPDNPSEIEAVVVRVAKDSSAANAGIVPGSVVLSIDGKQPTRDLPTGDGLARYERAAIVRARGTGSPETTSTWRVRMPDGTERDVSLTYAADTRPRVGFGNLPPFPVSLDSGMVPAELAAKHGATGASIGRIAFSGWFIPVAQPFNKAIDDMRASDGIV
ncbi:MAG: hypothetical protein JNK53_01070, partial [Phycisphaerae bacterium]|nr:hypothetical protein [Phycisphaerae bacterium]